MESQSSGDLAKEFVELMVAQKEANNKRSTHLKYEKVSGWKKKITFPIVLGSKFAGRLLVTAPILTVLEIGHNHNFPKENQQKKRRIVSSVFRHSLQSTYRDVYKTHFYQRINPADPAWLEHDLLSDGDDPVKRFGWH